MIAYLPRWVELMFLVTCVLTILLFYHSNGKPLGLTLLIVLWSVIQSVLAYSGFYQMTDSVPPRFALVVLPAAAFIIYGLLPKQQQWIFDNRDRKVSTFLHTVRLPVEIVLFELFTYQMVPKLMTFEGRNYDIVMGITAPVIAWLCFKEKISKRVLLVWNILGLGLVVFILINGLLSAELPFQQFGFEQPNRAVNYFPFILLPATIVPIVIWTHLSDILTLKEKSQ